MGKTITVQPGDTLLSIAHAEGIFDWRRIWDHPQNQTLCKKRSNPQVLYQGDQVYVPDKSESFKQLTLEVDHTYTFRTKKPQCFFSVYLKDESGQPYAGNKYRLLLGNDTFNGTTSADGLVCHPVAPTVKAGELTLWRNPNDAGDLCQWTLEVGHLNPCDTVSGIKARLRNLGYQVGPTDEQLDDQTKAAIKDFQRHMGRDQPSGEMDDETRNMLMQLQNQH